MQVQKGNVIFVPFFLLSFFLLYNKIVYCFFLLFPIVLITECDREECIFTRDIKSNRYYYGWVSDVT